MDNGIHKDEITPILEQIKTINFDLVRTKNFMIMNRIYNDTEILKKVLNEIRTIQDVPDKDNTNIQVLLFFLNSNHIIEKNSIL